VVPVPFVLINYNELQVVILLESLTLPLGNNYKLLYKPFLPPLVLSMLSLAIIVVVFAHVVLVSPLRAALMKMPVPLV
jgi:hypothetical protein